MLFTENILFDILVLLVTFVVVIITYLKWSFTYWKNKNVLQPPPSIPFGNMQSFGEKKISAPELFQKHYKQFKHKHVKYFGMNIIFKPILIPMDLDFIKTIMTKDFEYFTDHGIFINKEDDPLSAHLFSLGGSEWRNLRTKLTPTFTSGKMKMMYETVINCSEGLTKLVDDFFDKPLEISDVIGRFTTDVIGSCAFGIDCNSLKDADSEFRKYSKDVFKVSKKQAFVRIVWLLVPQISQLLKFKFTSVELSKFFMGVVSGTLDYREKNNVIRKDFMHLLIQLKNNVDIKEGDQVGQIKNTDASNSSKKVGLTFNEIAAQAFVFFVAGFETSSTLLTSCFYELAINPDVQFKLRKEINEILQKHGEKITYDALTEMTYMEKCVNETLRKYPPFAMLPRLCTKTYKVPDSDLVIEKGTMLFIPTLAIQRDEDYYPDPEKFDPERFNQENKSKRHPFAWLPFGEGPRACIGLRFAMMQIKVALTVLLKNYSFALNSKTKTPVTFHPDSVVLSIEGGVWLDVTKV